MLSLVSLVKSFLTSHAISAWRIEAFLRHKSQMLITIPRTKYVKTLRQALEDKSKATPETSMINLAVT